jgi:predicted NBD/HSP70 family sugar kinase
VKGVNHHSMNENNRYMILRAVSIYGPLSRAQLCDYTQLSKMTITNLVNEYIRQGVMEESGKIGTAAGRRADLLRIVPDSLLTLGVFIERGYAEIGIVNLNGSILKSERFEISPRETADNFLDTLLHICTKLVNDEWKDRIWGIGISAPGPLDPERGIILEPPGGFRGLINVPIGEVLYRAFDIPTYLELGTHVGALSELYYGNRKGYTNFLYITLNEWIGGCVVSDQKVWQGASGLAGLMGGMVVDRDALGQKPMSGCLQEYASISALIRWARENGSDADITWNEIVSKARHGDACACMVIDRLVMFFEASLVSAVALLDIQCIYISGSALLGEDLIIPRLQESVNRLMFAPDTRSVEVLAAKYPINAELIGVTALVMERRFER